MTKRKINKHFKIYNKRKSMTLDYLSYRSLGDGIKSSKETLEHIQINFSK